MTSGGNQPKVAETHDTQNEVDQRLQYRSWEEEGPNSLIMECGEWSTMMD